MKSYRICSCTGFTLGGKRLRRPEKRVLHYVLRKIEDKFFLNGVKDYLKDDYYNVGTILGEVTSEELTLVKVI